VALEVRVQRQLPRQLDLVFVVGKAGGDGPGGQPTPSGRFGRCRVSQR